MWIIIATFLVDVGAVELSEVKHSPNVPFLSQEECLQHAEVYLTILKQIYTRSNIIVGCELAG